MKGPVFSQLSDLPLLRLAVDSGVWYLLRGFVVILLTCLPSCELRKTWGSVLIVSVSYFLSRTFS